MYRTIRSAPRRCRPWRRATPVIYSGDDEGSAPRRGRRRWGRDPGRGRRCARRRRCGVLVTGGRGEAIARDLRAATSSWSSTAGSSVDRRGERRQLAERSDRRWLAELGTGWRQKPKGDDGREPSTSSTAPAPGLPVQNVMATAYGVRGVSGYRGVTAVAFPPPFCGDLQDPRQWWEPEAARGRPGCPDPGDGHLVRSPRSVLPEPVRRTRPPARRHPEQRRSGRTPDPREGNGARPSGAVPPRRPAPEVDPTDHRRDDGNAAELLGDP